MRKLLVLVMALLLSLTLVSAAFAHSSGYVKYFNNGNSGWVSDGQHGHYWSGDVDGSVVVVKGVYDFRDEYYRDYKHYSDYKYVYARDGKFYRAYDAKGNMRYYYDWDNDGNWYYYKDDNGKSHYVYIDPDREGKWERYYDQDGEIQYRYVIK